MKMKKWTPTHSVDGIEVMLVPGPFAFATKAGKAYTEEEWEAFPRYADIERAADGTWLMKGEVIPMATVTKIRK